MIKRTFNASTVIAAFAATAPAAAPKTAKPRVAPAITGTFAGLTIPEAAKTNRGSKSPYPFATINVGEAFGIKNKDAHQMSSIVSNQNRSKHNQAPKKDDAGNVIYTKNQVKDAAGNVVGETNGAAETVSVKEWRAVDVAKGSDLEKQIKGTPLEGSSVLVFRVK